MARRRTSSASPCCERCGSADSDGDTREASAAGAGTWSLVGSRSGVTFLQASRSLLSWAAGPLTKKLSILPAIPTQALGPGCSVQHFGRAMVLVCRRRGGAARARCSHPGSTACAGAVRDRGMPARQRPWGGRNQVGSALRLGLGGRAALGQCRGRTGEAPERPGERGARETAVRNTVNRVTVTIHSRPPLHHPPLPSLRPVTLPARPPPRHLERLAKRAHQNLPTHPWLLMLQAPPSHLHTHTQLAAAPVAARHQAAAPRAYLYFFMMRRASDSASSSPSSCEGVWR
jgi:hypothetical protein